jgi:hypothetical protein
MVDSTLRRLLPPVGGGGVVGGDVGEISSGPSTGITENFRMGTAVGAEPTLVLCLSAGGPETCTAPRIVAVPLLGRLFPKAILVEEGLGGVVDEEVRIILSRPST